MDGSGEMGCGADDGPPEQDGAREEREMLEIVEEAIAERRLVRPREMPEPQDPGVAEPRDGHSSQGLPDPPHGCATHEEPSGPDASPRRQGPEERRQGVGEKEGRRRAGDQEHVLDHVGGEAAMREGVEGGEERQGDAPEAGEGQQRSPPPHELRSPSREAPPTGGVGAPQEKEQSQDSRPVRPSQRRRARVATHTKKTMVPTRKRPNASFSTALNGSPLQQRDQARQRVEEDLERQDRQIENRQEDQDALGAQAPIPTGPRRGQARARPRTSGGSRWSAGR